MWIKLHDFVPSLFCTTHFGFCCFLNDVPNRGDSNEWKRTKCMGPLDYPNRYPHRKKVKRPFLWETSERLQKKIKNFWPLFYLHTFYLGTFFFLAFLYSVRKSTYPKITSTFILWIFNLKIKYVYFNIPQMHFFLIFWNICSFART